MDENLTDEAALETAIRRNDFAALLALAERNYPRAFYPVALRFYEHNNIGLAEYWARRAVEARTDELEVNSLLDKISELKKSEISERDEVPVEEKDTKNNIMNHMFNR